MKRRLASGLAVAVAAGALASPASATDNGWDYNNEFAKKPDGTQVDISDCVPTTRAPAGSNIPIFGFGGRQMSFAIGTTRAPDPCAPDKLRILKLERLTVVGRTTYMNRGGGDNAGATYGQAHAHVAASELASAPALRSVDDRRGNGRAAPACNVQVYSKPKVLPAEMFYKSAAEGVGAGSQWKNYGNPGADHAGETYNYILWNIPRRDVNGGEAVLGGGGIIRATIGWNTVVKVCDVSQQVLNSYAYQTNNVNGYTRWAYAQVRNPEGTTIYGWFLVSYKYGTDPAAPEVGLYDFNP